MSQKANPTLIGAFVLGAIVFLVVGALLLGAGSLFKTTSRAVVFFPGSVQGLGAGAPVTFRGVQIGTVAEVRLNLDLDTLQPSMPVYLELDPSRFTISHKAELEVIHRRPIKELIADGLYAKLGSQSLVTGQLLVELDIDPTEKTTLVGGDPSTIEIPAAPSDMERLKNTLAELPLSQIASKVLSVLDNLDRLLSSPELPKTLTSVEALTSNANQIMEGAKPIPTDLRQTLTSLQQTLGDMRKMIGTTNQVMGQDLKGTANAATGAFDHAAALLADAHTLVAENSAQRDDIDEALHNIASASRSLRLLTDDLQRRPNSVLFGR
jgi:paraquat-inducible protein B